MSDRVAVALAACAWFGAWWAHPLPWWAPIPGVVVACAVRRPVTAAVALVVLADVLAVRALDGLDPLGDAPFDGEITLVTDPEPTADGRLRFEATTSIGRVLTEVRSPGAKEMLAERLAGDLARVRGRTEAFGRPSEWSRSRHLVGMLRVESVDATATGAPPAAAVNAYRRMLDRGAASLDPEQRSLLSGLVLGDDRAQPPELTADFRAAGLTHLLAVSGQNVAFVLVVFGPMLRRIRIWPRFLLSVTVIAAFALLTRFEPSVLRAAVVAGVALFATTTGRPSGGVRHLALAVCALLVIDPLLVHSLGFRLSVAASTGVLVLAPRLAPRLPGPRWFREGTAVTVGAQLAVAPVLIPVLGPMPMAALPANIAAGPLAGMLMVWGLAAGTAAGALGGSAAWLLHRPSAVGLDALDLVASVGASLPLGSVDLRHILVLAVVVVLARLDRFLLRVVAGALGAIVILAPVLTPTVDGRHLVGRDASIFVDGRVAVVEVGARADPADVVEALRAARVVAVGMVVVRSTEPAAAASVEAVRARFPVGAVIAPPGFSDDAVVPPDGFRTQVGRIVVVVDGAGPPLRARVRWGSREPDRAVADEHIGRARERATWPTRRLRGRGPRCGAAVDCGSSRTLLHSPGAPRAGPSAIRHRSTGRRRGAGQQHRRGRSAGRRRCRRDGRDRGARPGAGARSCRGARHHRDVRFDPGRRRSSPRCRRPVPRPPRG
ncbi:MAG: ComEC/Rec2 family competence protein [Acidimicrobiales bacterium]|nr:ComEC/Rec2 family competence protein [Acidimicrobiales bacterium]